MTGQGVAVNAAFDGGNIEVERCAAPEDIRLNIRADNAADFRQWFYFRLTGARGHDCSLQLLNAGACSYPGGWENYQACASVDGRTWVRVPTSYADGVLTITYRPPADAIYFAYFAPYSLDRHAALVAGAVATPMSP